MLKWKEKDERVLKGDFSSLNEKESVIGNYGVAKRWKALMRKWSGKLLL